jgi:hypothetical protein
MSAERVTTPRRRALAAALIFVTTALVVGSTASCSEAPCEDGATVCSAGRGRTCTGGAWLEFEDGPCMPAPRPTPPVASGLPDATPPDAEPGDASGDARDASADAGDAADAGDCPADLGAALGTPCPKEGQFCGSCGNPCQFCNLLRCERGKWGRLEVPPAPCDAGDGG